MGYVCYDVKCPACGDIYYETTELFDPNKMATGEMLRFKSKYGPGGYNWSMPFTDYDMAEALVCVECGGSLAPSGFLMVEGLPDNRFSLEHLEEINRALKGTGGPEQANPIDPPDIGGSKTLVVFRPDLSGPVIQEMLKFGVESMILDGKPPEEVNIPTDEELANELIEDPLAKYTDQKPCPECGRFFSVDEWPNHLASHPADVREQILKKPELVMDSSPEQPQGKKGKVRGLFKGKKAGPEIEETEPKKFECPLCESGFDEQKDYDSHLITHDMGDVRQVTDN